MICSSLFDVIVFIHFASSINDEEVMVFCAGSGAWVGAWLGRSVEVKSGVNRIVMLRS